MKIAVASDDGARVAGTLASARCVLVFQVIENEVALLERRPMDESAARPSGSPEGIPADGDEAGVSGELVRHLLDCQFLVAGEFTAMEEQRVRRLGLCALAALGGKSAEAAVRFAVSGTPPDAGSACGSCAGRPLLVGPAEIRATVPFPHR